MLKRSTFSVEEIIEDHDVGRRTVILEKSASAIGEQSPDSRVNILILMVVVLFAAVVFLTMNVMNLNTKVEEMENNDPYKMCWVVGSNGKI